MLKVNLLMKLKKCYNDNILLAVKIRNSIKTKINPPADNSRLVGGCFTNLAINLSVVSRKQNLTFQPFAMHEEQRFDQ